MERRRVFKRNSLTEGHSHAISSGFIVLMAAENTSTGPVDPTKTLSGMLALGVGPEPSMVLCTVLTGETAMSL